MSEPIRIFGLSDPLDHATGFARHMRELFVQLGKTGRYELAYLSRGWGGSARFAGVQTYSADSYDEVCAAAFPRAAADFGTPFLLYTLMDPWQTGWLSHAESNAYAKAATTKWLSAHRDELRWIGYYPIDGEGLERGAPPFWYDQFLNGPEVTVHMSSFSERLMRGRLSTRQELIPHAIDEELFAPAASEWRSEARKKMGVAHRVVVLCVMANRARKYWPEVLLAFAKARERHPDLHLIGVCGDPKGESSGSWALVDIAASLRLLVKKGEGQSWVTFVSTVPDQALASLYKIADVALLISGGEGYGYPQVEAHAVGLPCIVGRYSASEEKIVDPSEVVDPHGWSFAGNNVIRRPIYKVSDIAARIIEWHDPREREAIKQRARAQVERSYSWKALLPRWEALFEREWAMLVEKQRQLGLLAKEVSAASESSEGQASAREEAV